jgi:dTDP-4-dehydrorhamnose 3,5-epimerase-like enzyme
MKDIQLINLPKIIDERGNLTFLQENVGLPFNIARVFWTYDVAAGETRGGHAYKTQNELICVVSGSADIVLTKKNGEIKKITLNRPDVGILIPNRVWRHIENYATNTVTMHFTDAKFDNNDYIRSIDEL